MENNKNKKSVKFQGDMSNYCDFIQVFVFTSYHHLKITEFWMPPLRIHACSIAISSVVKTDRIGFSLILDVWPSSGTTKASPTVLAVGSLLPSV